jgi:glycosyltransferase involved in cell wall biosynthesis
MTVSVVIPIYHSEDTISACIESVLGQTFTDWELILVDDGSTDGSGRICDDYAARDRRIKVVHQENKGRSEARWRGVALATGEWVCFVDSDDTLPHSALSLLCGSISKTTDIVFGNGYTLRGEERRLIPMSEFRHLAVRGEGTIGVPWGSLYRRRVLTRWMFDVPRRIYNGEDYLFWLRLVFATERAVAVVFEPVYNKGEEHTSNIFMWTSDYCYELNELRKASIPIEMHDDYMLDMLDDRLANLFAVAVCEKKNKWKGSRYYQDIIDDMRISGMKMPMKKRLFFSLPSVRLRKLYSLISNTIR